MWRRPRPRLGCGTKERWKKKYIFKTIYCKYVPYWFPGTEYHCDVIRIPISYLELSRVDYWLGNRLPGHGSWFYSVSPTRIILQRSRPFPPICVTVNLLNHILHHTTIPGPERLSKMRKHRKESWYSVLKPQIFLQHRAAGFYNRNVLAVHFLSVELKLMSLRQVWREKQSLEKNAVDGTRKALRINVRACETSDNYWKEAAAEEIVMLLPSTAFWRKEKTCSGVRALRSEAKSCHAYTWILAQDASTRTRNWQTGTLRPIHNLLTTFCQLLM